MSSERSSWWRRVTLRDVVVFTAPALALALWVFGSACLDYHRIRQFDDWWSNATSVRKFGFYRLRAAWNLPRATALRERIPAEDEARGTVRLQVDRSAWAEASNDVGGHWGEWLQGALIDGDDYREVELRFRGDGSAHWTSEKKSLSIKTKKDALHKGQRRLNFSVKDVLPQYVVNSLAADFDLLGPETRVVPLYVNEHYYGIFRYVEQVDESFLRRNRRMPGNVFRGDTAERGEYYKNLPRELFVNPEIWERVAVNDRPGAPGGTPQEWAIRRLIEDLNGATREDHERLMARLDQGELSRLLALMLACGDPYHMSGIHNQLWYEDPVTGVLHPIVWDLRLLDLERPLPGSNWNRFWRGVLRDPELFAGALEHLALWSADDRLLERASRRAGRAYARYRDHFEYDQLRSGVIHPIGRPEDVAARLSANLELLDGWLRDSRARTWLGSGLGSDGPELVLDLLVEGRAGVELAELVIEPAGTPDPAGANVELWADADRDGRRGPGDRRVELAGLGREGKAWRARPVERERLLPGAVAAGAELSPEPLHYRYFLTGAAGLEVELLGVHTGLPVAQAAWRAGQAIPSTTSWHPWERAAPAAEHLVLSGDVRLEQDLVIALGSTLTIEPGTTIVLAPDVSIVSRGRVDARGTDSAPIALVQADERLPWGVFALQGDGASGSRLEHVRFRGGGGALIGRVEYKGAVCVHRAEDVEFRRCDFAANLRCDDLINVVQGDVDLIRCEFDDANADAIDYDLSTGRIADCEIRDPGNDGVDLMTCSPLIARCRIVGAGDKGISIGEAARPTVVDCVIEDCERGFEVKDLSEPLILDTEVRGCGVALLQRHKNWRYAAAGRAQLVGGQLIENEVDYQGLDGAVLARHEGDATWFRALASGRARRVVGGGFADDLTAPALGWQRFGSARWLAANERALEASFRIGAGGVGKRVNWHLAADGSRYALLVEAAGEGLEDVFIGLSTSHGVLERELELDARADFARFTLIELAPGDYPAIAITARTQPRPNGETGGTLRLFRCTVLAMTGEEP